MKRRDLLTTACVTIAGLAGCLGDATESKNRTKVPSTKSTTSSVSISEYKCPPHKIRSGPSVCSQTVETESASVYLLPSKTTVDVDTKTLELTLHNNSSTDLEFNPYEWTIVRKSSTGWDPIAKDTNGNGRLTVDSGDTHAWTLDDVVGYVTEDTSLKQGTYTAEISVPNPTGSNWIRCIALFRLA